MYVRMYVCVYVNDLVAVRVRVDKFSVGAQTQAMRVVDGAGHAFVVFSGSYFRGINFCC